MNSKIIRVAVVFLIFVSCKKEVNNSYHSNDIGKAEQMAATSVASLSTNEAVPASIYPGVSYSASTRMLNITASIAWGNIEGPSDDDLPNYSVSFSLSGNATGGSGGQFTLTNSSGIGYTTNISSPNNSTVIMTVNVSLRYRSTVIASSSQTLSFNTAIDVSNAPIDSIATITLNKNTATNYTLQASHLAYLDGHPLNTLYFYAFYIPTPDERNNLNRRSLFLGYTGISGQSFFPATGSLTFELPTVYPTVPGIPVDPNTEYNPSNIRIVLSKKLYPINYFTNPLANVGYVTYLIDNCVNDAVIYDVYCKGLNSTNGIFRTYSYPTGMNFAIGSMDKILDYQIYTFKARGFLQ